MFDKETMQKEFDRWYMPMPNTGCWEWMGCVKGKGYGHLYGMGAHRISWILHKGSIPKGMYVCHKCDVRSCVNPDHLFIGTPKDNCEDMKNKGRAKNGRENFYGPPCPKSVRRKIWLAKNPQLRKPRPNQKAEANWNSRLNWEKVRDIRTKRMCKAAFARLYGVSFKAVKKIWDGEAWKETDASPP